MHIPATIFSAHLRCPFITIFHQYESPRLFSFKSRQAVEIQGYPDNIILPIPQWYMFVLIWCILVHLVNRKALFSIDYAVIKLYK